MYARHCLAVTKRLLRLPFHNEDPAHIHACFIGVRLGVDCNPHRKKGLSFFISCKFLFFNEFLLFLVLTFYVITNFMYGFFCFLFQGIFCVKCTNVTKELLSNKS